jgi:hypothetical protein
VGIAMMTAEPMVARGAHYTALLDMIDHRGATELQGGERDNCWRPRMSCCSASLTAS